MIYIDFDNLNEKYTNLLDQIFKNNKKNYETFLKKNLIGEKFFFLSNFLSKDIFSNLSYIGYCQILFIEKLIKLTKGRIKISVSNYYIYKNIRINFLSNKRLEIVCRNYWISKIFIYPKIIFKLFFLLNFIFWQLINKSNERADKLKKKNYLNLYDTTFTSSCFKNKTFRDRYYKNDLFKKGNNFLCPENLLFKNTSSCLKILKKEKINCLYRFDFLNFLDYFTCLYKVIFTSFLKIDKLNNKNIKYLIFYDNLNNICNLNYFVGLLNYFFFSNLYERKIKILNIFHKFENQSAGKGFILGSKSFFPESKIIGICDYFINYDFSFSRIPLKYEVQNNLIPKENILVSKNYAKYFKYHFHNFQLRFGTFRYKKYKSINNKKNNSFYKKFNINVFLPIQKNETIKIIDQIKKINFDENQKYQCQFYLKFHPNFNDDFKKKFLCLSKHNIFICERKFESSMKRSNLNIAGASTSSIESILYRRPVLCPVNSFFIYDSPLINFVPKRLYSMYFNSNDLKRKIDKYVKLLSNKKHIRLLEKSFSKAKKKIIKDL